MSTASTPLYVSPAFRYVIPGFTFPSGPGGGGAFFERESNYEDRDPQRRLLPSTSPLITLKWPQALVGAVVRIFQQLDTLAEDPVYITVVPPSRRTSISGIFADERVPSDFAGILCIGDKNNISFEVFQLSWGRAPRILRPLECGVPEADEFVWISASNAFRVSAEDGEVTADALPTMSIYTESAQPVEGGDRRDPWSWEVVCDVLETPPPLDILQSQQARDLTSAVLSALS